MESTQWEGGERVELTISIILMSARHLQYQSPSENQVDMVVISLHLVHKLSGKPKLNELPSNLQVNSTPMDYMFGMSRRRHRRRPVHSVPKGHLGDASDIALAAQSTFVPIPTPWMQDNTSSKG